jgi:hypothetical protein
MKNKFFNLVIVICAIFLLSSCVSHYDPYVREGRRSGAAVGAITGAIIGNNIKGGNSWGGAAIGAAIGGLAGDRYGKINSMYYRGYRYY